MNKNMAWPKRIPLDEQLLLENLCDDILHAFDQVHNAVIDKYGLSWQADRR